VQHSQQRRLALDVSGAYEVADAHSTPLGALPTGPLPRAVTTQTGGAVDDYDYSSSDDDDDAL
jgi:hypothetical protein